MVTRWEVTKAVRNSNLPAPCRLIMLTLADSAETGTAEIPPQHTPSLKVLAQETGLGESTVKRRLNELEAAGWVIRSRPTIDDARLRGERTRYQLAIPAAVGPAQGPDGAHEGLERAQPWAQTEPSPGPTVGPNKEESDQSQIKSDPSLPRTSADKKRGTRIPDDFTVTPEMAAWAREHVPQLAGKGETEKFIDYWRAASGRNAVKRDWVAAWRNWMRNAAERYPANGYRATTLPPSSAPRPLKPDEVCPEHRGQRKGACRYCAADAKAAGAR